MNNDFVTEILRATDALRSGDPAGATAVIRTALAGAGLGPIGADGRIDGLGGKGRMATFRSDAHASPRLRRPLGEVLRTLSSGRKTLGLEGPAPGLGLPARLPDLPMPDGAEFRDLTHACPAGTRRYRLYVPASAAEGLQGLVVMLHGCTQGPEDFAAGTGMNLLAEERRLLVAYPAQTGGDNAMSCWNWFRPGDQTRDAGEPAILAGLTRTVRDDFAIPHDRVFVAGLSAGGAMAAILGATHPDLYAAIGVHSGLAHGAANDVASAFGAMRGQGGIAGAPARRPSSSAEGPRVIVFHGDADPTVHPSNAARIIASHGGDPTRMARSEKAAAGGTRAYSRSVADGRGGAPRLELWMIAGAPHAWSGGHPSGSHTDPQGPDASREMVGFFLQDADEARARPPLILN